VLRARPRGMLLGAFFDVPNLTEVAAPVRRFWTVGGGTSPVDSGSLRIAGVTTAGASLLLSPATGLAVAATQSALTSKRRQKPRKDRAFSLGNERERYRPSARTMPRRCRPRNEPDRSHQQW
jgi:hypothetical protein